MRVLGHLRLVAVKGMRALQLGHGSHEGALAHVALHGGHKWLLVGRGQRLRELDRLQGG